jgi:O-antigen/teichoic acid export membrane protein
MGENSKIVKNSLILYFRLIVVSIIGLISSRYILQALGAQDFGLYNVVGGIVFMMALFNNVMVSTTYRFIAFEMGKGDEEGVNRMFNTSLVIHIFLAVFCLFIAETLGVYYIKHYLKIGSGSLEDALFVFHLSMLSTFVTILSVPYQGLITAKEKFSVSAIIEIIRSFLALAAVMVIVFYTGNRLKLYAVLMAVVTVVPSVLYMGYAYLNYAGIIKWHLQRKLSKYREMFSYSAWILFGASAATAEVQGSALILNLFFGTLLNAGFGIANQVNNVIKTFSQSLNQATIPQITKSFSGGDTNRTMQLVIFSSKYSFLLMLLPALPVLLEANFVLKLWLGEVPQYTVVFVQIMLMNALISTSNAGIPAAVQATGKIKYYQIILSTVMLLALPVSYYLLKAGFPPYALLLAYTGTAIINLFVRQIVLKKLIDFDVKDFFNKAYSKMIAVCLICSPLFLIKELLEEGFTRFFIMSPLSVIWLIAGIYLVGSDQKEKELFRYYLKNIVNRVLKPKSLTPKNSTVE